MRNRRQEPFAHLDHNLRKAFASPTAASISAATPGGTTSTSRRNVHYCVVGHDFRVVFHLASDRALHDGDPPRGRGGLIRGVS